MTEKLLGPRLLLVMGAMLAFYVCVGVLVPVLPVFIENGMSSGEAMVGVTAVAFSVAAVFSRPLITLIGVQWGRRALMIGGGFVGAAGALGLVLVSEPWQVLPLRALMGIGEAALFVGASTIAVDLAPPNRRAEAASYLSLSVFGGLAIGPILGEAVLGDVPSAARGLGIGNFDAVFVLAAAMALVAALASFLVPRWVGPKPERHPVRWLEKTAVFPGLLLASGIAAWTAFATFLPTYAKDLGISGSAPFFFLYSVICVILRFFGARWPEQWGLRRTVFGALSLLFVGMVVVSSWASEPGIWVSTLLLSFGMTFLYPSLLAMSVNGVSDAQRVAVVSSFTMFFEIGATAGGLVLGGVAELFGKRMSFAGGAVFIMFGLATLLWVRRPVRAEAVSVSGG